HRGAIHCRYRRSHNPHWPGTPAWRLWAALFGLVLGVARRVFRRLIGRHPVALFEPAAEIDIGATLRAEGLMPRDSGLVADRAAALAGGKGCDAVFRHDFDIGSPSHDVKRGAVGARLDGNGDLPPEP